MGTTQAGAMGEEARLSVHDKSMILEHYGPDAGPLVELAKRIGPAAMDHVLELLGGERPVIPEPESFWAGLARKIRDERIRGEFTGNNIGELAAKYELCERQVRRIVCDG